MNFNINKRKLRYGSYSVVLTIFVVAIIIALNVLVNMASFSWDMTPNSAFSIGDKTKEILSDLDKDVTIHALFDEVEFKERYVELYRLLSAYESYDGVDIEFIDADRNPGTIKKLDPDNFYKLESGVFLFESGDKKKKVVLSDFIDYSKYDPYTGQNSSNPVYEQTLTGAMLYVTAQKTPKIYFATGHNEIGLDNIQTFAQYLERNNFEIDTLNILTAEEMPEDADMIVFVSPQKDLVQDERMKMVDFLEQGKGMMLFIDPMQQTVAFDEFNKLVSEYNIEINNDIIYESDSDFYIPGQPAYLLANAVNEGYKVFTPFARSVSEKKNTKEWITTEVVLETSESAVSTNIDTAEESEGKSFVALRTENAGGFEPTRVFVMGNSAFIADQVVASYFDNMEFVLSEIKWTLNQKGESLYIPAKKLTDTSITINQLQATTLSLAMIIIIPIILFGLGIIIFVRRKNL